MQVFAGRTAVVTGAASGIGRALALRSAQEGMRVALADVDLRGLDEALAAVRARGGDAIAVPTDVSRSEAVEALADAVESAFGPVHLVFNNAGVLVGGCAWERPVEDWQWVLGVNLWGAIHGARVFLPRMLAHGEPAQMVNTASVGGFTTGPWLAPYLVSKHAVVALTECLHHELAALGSRVRVSALCPGAVSTGIGASERVRPDALRARRAAAARPEAERFAEALRAGIAGGAAPEQVAERAFAGIREGRFWILPDPGFGERALARVRDLVEGRDPAPLTGRSAWPRTS
jgi:NAD(P)-dependent dehydrogenase (short-subunit alcohol dehydrogenase family)